MLLLVSTSDKVQLVTTGTANISVHASYVDLSGSTVTPGRLNTLISSAATTDVVSSPGASTQRTVKTLHIRNTHASSSNTVTVQHTDGTTVANLISCALPAGWALHYDEGAGFEVLDNQGRGATNATAGSLAATVNSLNTVVTTSDVVNNNAVANTLQDLTGLSFSVTAGETYWFRAVCPYDAAATTTGARFSINGPASPTRLHYTSLTCNGATANIISFSSSYGSPSAAAGTSLTSGNVSVIEGIIAPASSGTLQVQFASEVASSAITAKAGCFLQWMRTI